MNVLQTGSILFKIGVVTNYESDGRLLRAIRERLEFVALFLARNCSSATAIYVAYDELTNIKHVGYSVIKN